MKKFLGRIEKIVKIVNYFFFFGINIYIFLNGLLIVRTRIDFNPRHE